MRQYFHCDTTVYKRRFKAVVAALLTPLIAACVFCAANVIFNMRSDGDRGFAIFMVFAVVGCVALGMIICFAAAYVTDKKSRRHARYTYFDILPHGMVYSRYAGEHMLYGERTIYRRLCYIPFAQLTAVSRDGKQSPSSITLMGEIREYFFSSDNLGYHIGEDGDICFDNAELNERFFEKRQKLVISGDFGNTRQLERSIQHYLELFRNAPAKKQFNIADHIAARRKRTLHTSNALLDMPSFDRRW